jgi:hypothetical protein
VYGSDVGVSDVYIAVAGGELPSALEKLLEHGHPEKAQTTIRFRSITPTKDSGSGWPGYRLRHPSPTGDAVGILFIPSSLWHVGDYFGPFENWVLKLLKAYLNYHSNCFTGTGSLKHTDFNAGSSMIRLLFESN